MADKKQNRAAQERRERLFRQLVQSPHGRLEFDDVKDLYGGKNRNRAFKEDCGALVRDLGRLTPLCNVLWLPDLGIRCQKGALRAPDPFREFLQQLYSDSHRDHKRHIAQRLVVLPDVLPSSGSLYLGMGRQIFLLAWELLQKRRRYQISTASMEVASLVYHWPCGKSQLFVRGNEVNYGNGGLRNVPRPLKVNTAVVSVDSVKSDGRMYSANADDSAETDTAMKLAEDRVILLVDRGKFNKVIGHVEGPITLPAETDGKKVYLVTDKAPHEWTPPRGVQVVDLSKPARARRASPRIVTDSA